VRAIAVSFGDQIRPSLPLGGGGRELRGVLGVGLDTEVGYNGKTGSQSSQSICSSLAPDLPVV